MTGGRVPVKPSPILRILTYSLDYLYTHKIRYTFGNVGRLFDIIVIVNIEHEGIYTNSSFSLFRSLFTFFRAPVPTGPCIQYSFVWWKGNEIFILLSTTGNYSCLRVELTFNRDRAFYFTTVFIPDIILVTSSFITFWLEWNAVPARVMLGVTTMLNFFTTR